MDMYREQEIVKESQMLQKYKELSNFKNNPMGSIQIHEILSLFQTALRELFFNENSILVWHLEQ